jgi:lysine 2,3-aminomutase
LGKLVRAGLPVLNQAVLLRGVNDDVSVLKDLCQALVRLQVSPYYLHHTDPVPGNAHLRVSIEQGLALHKALSKQVSGVALPAYVIDLPDGSGKFPVEQALRLGLLSPLGVR